MRLRAVVVPDQGQIDAAGQGEAALAATQCLAARCTATSDEEHAVSTTMPAQSDQQIVIRPAAMLATPPVPA